jgi:hypothetical protein
MKRAPPALPEMRVIPRDAILALEELRLLLGLPKNTLKREARLRRLRVSKRAGRLWTCGEWVHEWLRSGEVHRGSRCESGNGDLAAPMRN